MLGNNGQYGDHRGWNWTICRNRGTMAQELRSYTLTGGSILLRMFMCILDFSASSPRHL